MVGNRVFRVALASALCLLGALYGCAAAPEKQAARKGAQSAETAPVTTPATDLSCSNHPYGVVKNGMVEKSAPVGPDLGSATFNQGDSTAGAGKILIQTQPLDAVPPEIVRIQRGLVKRFTGKFIRDGQVAWAGVDLDRLVAVSVERRVYDRRNHQTRPVADPRLSQPGHPSFARKWSEPDLVEVEVVTIFPITAVEARTFVCAANPAWADKNPPPDDDSDAIVDGVTDYFLLDRQQQTGIPVRYVKPVELGGLLAVVLGLVWQHAPPGSAW